ncbi:MAG TPA: hypothetical protein VKZ65_11570 [Glycomyces sp.]|nr:hypothetical protein [Glycomyces sp.]
MLYSITAGTLLVVLVITLLPGGFVANPPGGVDITVAGGWRAHRS